MGKPKKVNPSLVNTNYDWGEFGSANENGVNFSPVASMSVRSAQSGTNQYVNELINPSYDNVSFKARQDILDANNRQYANQLGAAALSRGARGSATQSILNSIMANRNNDMRNAMTSEDTRVQNILSALAGVENNYFNQSNTMANRVLDLVLANQAATNAARDLNVKKYNEWKDNLISGTASVLGAAIGGYFGGPMGASAGSQAGAQVGNQVNSLRND